ncbi:folate-binding protein YgfZ [Caulobacter sp. S45]|uniref:CAF17-like 4Fe-4S cluster assembly/insertion protein YgfZ n=1 Tax=Caulobacter sp. S45 TaxID=1641861 RepID=UPI0015765150|nr:folate-binding protein YgfZ [Caulobacter sp. S45]
MASPLSSPRFATLPERALIRVSGAEWRGFLQGLITQDVETLEAGAMRYGALLTPQGRLLYDLFVTAEDGGALLDAPAAGREGLAARLRMYRLRAKVEIELVEGAVVVLFGGSVDPGQGWRADPRLAALGWRGVDLPAPAGCLAASVQDHDLHRLALGVADLTRDALADRVYALEANFDLLNAVDFKKGCFVGQEITSRMKRRSVVKSRMVPLRFQGPAPCPGAEVLNGSLRAGEVWSGAEGIALALLRLDRAVDAELTVEGRRVRLDVPQWLSAAVAEAISAQDVRP